jgi:hypothetical protein
MRRALASLTLVFCASCAVQDGLPSDASTVRAASKPAASGSVARGETRLLLRSIDAAGRDVRGATCRVESALFAAEAVTPARVLVPYYGEASPPVSVACNLGGLSGSDSVSIVPAGGGGGGVAWPSVGVSVNSDGGVGVGLGLGYYGGRTRYAQTAYGYPPITIVLR